jgi:hypothetical protein
MTKSEAYEKAWRLGFKGDFSLVDEIYHAEYSAVDHTTGIKTNLKDDKNIAITLSDSVVMGPYQAASESDDSLSIKIFSRFKDYEIFRLATTQATYKDGKIITQKTDGQELNSDPSEGGDWNWEVYQ